MSEVFKPLPVVHGKSLVHSLESHNYWAEIKRPCPYCLIGSKPVHKVLVVEKVNIRDNKKICLCSKCVLSGDKEIN